MITSPTEINLEVLKLGSPSDHDSNNYEMMFNPNSHDNENLAFHFQNNKMSKLHQNDRRIEQLSLENFKLKKEK